MLQPRPLSRLSPTMHVVHENMSGGLQGLDRHLERVFRSLFRDAELPQLRDTVAQVRHTNCRTPVPRAAGIKLGMQKHSGSGVRGTESDARIHR